MSPTKKINSSPTKRIIRVLEQMKMISRDQSRGGNRTCFCTPLRLSRLFDCWKPEASISIPQQNLDKPDSAYTTSFRETRPFIATYYHDNAWWDFIIFAYDFEDAEARIKKLTWSKIESNGPIYEIPIPNFWGKMFLQIRHWILDRKTYG